ncbi:hypothetical protein NIES4073_67940 [Kalymmatonema gypsitolerans NIES-4073]|nr:hypothetical protein NIES4073_67940 [Scytonema sp. NIES-4073]
MSPTHARSYFELPYEAEEILAEFDYSLQRAELFLSYYHSSTRRPARTKAKNKNSLAFCQSQQ